MFSFFFHSLKFIKEKVRISYFPNPEFNSSQVKYYYYSLELSHYTHGTTYTYVMGYFRAEIIMKRERSTSKMYKPKSLRYSYWCNYNS